MTSRHAECVDAWLARAPRRPATALHDAFQAAFDAVCARARTPLGEVTLAAIVERVVHTASDRHPALRRSAPGGVLVPPDFRAALRAVPASELEDAARLLLVELLALLGNLTADVLTPALHAELASLPAPKPHARAVRRSPSKQDKRKP